MRFDSSHLIHPVAFRLAPLTGQMSGAEWQFQLTSLPGEVEFDEK